jgi:DNA ligase (NAD+)
VYIRCPNRKCQAQWKERLRYFAGRNAMDIEGLGDRLVDQLVDQGLVLGYGDLYRLTVDQLEPLERMGRKSSESLVKAIEASRKLGLARLLNALAIRHVGPRVAQVLASHFDSMENLRAADLAALAEVNEIGPVIAQSVYDYLHSDEGTQAVDELGAAGVRMEAPPAAGVAQHLAGKTLVVTGALARYGRDEIEALIVKHGGRAASSVSKHTDYVVAGEKAGSKLDKARQLGIPIISEAEFEAMIGK